MMSQIVGKNDFDGSRYRMSVVSHALVFGANNILNSRARDLHASITVSTDHYRPSHSQWDTRRRRSRSRCFLLLTLPSLRTLIIIQPFHNIKSEWFRWKLRYYFRDALTATNRVRMSLLVVV
jgi:hypothetical protein